MNKIHSSIDGALAGIEDGMAVMIGGFGGAGAPIELIHALVEIYKRTGSPGDLTVINNNAGNGAVGIAAMIYAGMVAKMVCSFPRSSDPKAFTDKYLAGEIGLELVPQGTLAERIRAGGAGIPAFYTPSSYGTDVADSKGNLTYRKAARNFSPLMAMAARTTIVQASRIVEPGEIDAEQVITPGIFVDRIVEVADPKQEEALLREGAQGGEK